MKRDMRDISFREEFDRALLLFTSFGYFSDEDNFRVLKNVATALKPEVSSVWTLRTGIPPSKIFVHILSMIRIVIFR
jgi:hypothetical protein